MVPDGRGDPCQGGGGVQGRVTIVSGYQGRQPGTRRSPFTHPTRAGEGMGTGGLVE